MGSILKRFQECPEEHERALQEYDDFENIKTLLLDAYPVANKQVAHQTLYFRSDFDRETTKKFLAKCKGNSVSFHTGFFTATQVAVVELLKDAGVLQDSYDISSCHVVNARRFWSKEIDGEVQFGGNILSLPVKFTVPSDWKNIFWTTVCREHHLLFMTRLNGFKSQMYEISRSERMLPMMNKMKEMNEGEPMPFQKSPSRYYDTNNMGDITTTLSGSVARSSKDRILNAHVAISDLLRSTSTHNGGLSCTHVVQTLKGRLLHSLDYNSEFMDQETAKKYIQKVAEVVRLVADF